MADKTYDLNGTRVYECSADGPPPLTRREATDLISVAWSEKATLVVIPVARLADDFFRLKTGIAGEIVSRFVTCRLRLAIVGDISVMWRKAPRSATSSTRPTKALTSGSCPTWIHSRSAWLRVDSGGCDRSCRSAIRFAASFVAIDKKYSAARMNAWRTVKLFPNALHQI